MINDANSSLTLIVKNVRQLTPHIYAYELHHIDGIELPLVTAGSYIGIPTLSSNGRLTTVNYQIFSNPIQRNFYEIAALITPDKTEHHFQINDQLHCTLPANNFHLHADASPAVLIADAIGIVAIKPIAQTLDMRGRRFHLHYTGPNLREMAFVEELQENMKRQLKIYNADENINIDLVHVFAEASPNALFYIAGSKTLLQQAEAAASALGIARDRIQSQLLSNETEVKDKPVILELALSNKLIKVNADQPLLTALRDAGINVDYDCCAGDCGTCAVKILEGEAAHRDHVLSAADKANGFICVCVSRAKSEKLVLEL